MTSLKKKIKEYLFSVYPKEISSIGIEEFAREQGFLGETGRKRCGDLVKDGFVETRVKIITKQDGKCVEVAFHKYKKIPEQTQLII